MTAIIIDQEIATTRRGPALDIVVSIIIGVVLTALSYAVGIAANWIDTASLGLLEPFAVLTSYSCTYLCVKERRINYPIGIVSSAAYAYLFYKFDLVASMVLNIYLVPTLIYGWFRWRPDQDTRPVTRLPLRLFPLYLAVTAGVWAGARGVIALFDGTMAWADALILAAKEITDETMRKSPSATKTTAIRSLVSRRHLGRVEVVTDSISRAPRQARRSARRRRGCLR